MIHFARAWRPAKFEDVIGQELAVSLLKNSLYRNRLFPVYLLAGQRGCGKTTLARIFAAAVNCTQLSSFRERPHEVQIPCGTCSSCCAMSAGNHPDFHEIDAASHTGVDHVRHIIETTLLLPQMGAKKVYLIDEAHMLSRAAFNALLKTLEEPVDTALFLLATTDIHKIIDTVTSRCFQIFLKPISTVTMVNYLAQKCDAEKIPYDEVGLVSIVEGSEGSLRDAINRLERVLLAHGSLSAEQDMVSGGRWSMRDSFDLIDAFATQKSADALALIRTDRALASGVPEVWRMLLESLRMLLLAHHGVPLDVGDADRERLQTCRTHIAKERLITVAEYLFSAEQLLLKTAHQQIMFEVVVAKLCSADTPSLLPPAEPVRPHPRAAQQQPERAQERVASSTRAAPVTNSVMSKTGSAPEGAQWEAFIKKITDPLQMTILSQSAKTVADKGDMLTISLAIPPSLHLFRDMVEAERPVWEKELQALYQRAVLLTVEFSTSELPTPAQRTASRGVQAPKPTTLQEPRPSTGRQRITPDETTKKVLDFFPGTVTQLKGDAS